MDHRQAKAPIYVPALKPNHRTDRQHVAAVDPHKKSGAEEPFETDGTEIFELYRELSQFEEAKKALDLCTED
jgi:hypothetical protein